MHTASAAARLRRSLLACAFTACAIAATAPAALAQNGGANRPINDPRWLLFPAVAGWYDGKIALYASTDTSDAGVANGTPKLNYVPRLAYAANTNAVDDIYTVTNFAQSNIIPSHPQPAGPNNADPNYTPLWQLSKVTWNSGTHPHVLRSEQEVLSAAASGLVTLLKTNIIVNCPVVYTPSGGRLAGVKIIDIN